MHRGRIVIMSAAMALSGAAGLCSAQTAEFFAVGSMPGGFDFSQVWGVTRDGSEVIGVTNAEHNGVTDFFGFRAPVGGAAELIPTIVSRDIRSISGDAGVIAGIAYMQRPDLPEFDLTGWYWTEATGPVELWSRWPGDGSVASGVSRDGSSIVGMTNFFVDFGGTGEEFSDAYVWTQATGKVELPHLSGQWRSEAFGVSGDGSVVGGYEQNFEAERTPVIWERSDGWAIREMSPPAGSLGSAIVMVISDNGEHAAGFALMHRGEGLSFREDGVLWSVATGGATLLGQTPAGFRSAIPSAISDDGRTIAGTWNASLWFDLPEGRAFIWREGEGARSLKEVLATDHGLDLDGWELLSAFGMSDDGKTIAGHALDPRGTMTGYVVRLDSSACPGDLNGDGQVDSADFFLYLDWFAAGDSRADLNRDGEIDSVDFFLYLDLFVQGCD